MFQTLSQIVFPDAFQEHNSSINNFVDAERAILIEEKNDLIEQINEKEEMLQFKNNEIETVAQVHP